MRRKTVETATTMRKRAKITRRRGGAKARREEKDGENDAEEDGNGDDEERSRGARRQGGWRRQGRRRGEGRGKRANKTSGGQNNGAEPYGSAPGFSFFLCRHVPRLVPTPYVWAFNKIFFELTRNIKALSKSLRQTKQVFIGIGYTVAA